MLRVACLIVVASLSASGMQCDCVDIGIQRLKSGSDLVFQAVVTGFHGSGENRMVIFDLSRVWKGKVTRTFEMRAIEGPCISFYSGLLKVGNELLVFASRGRHISLEPSDIYFSRRCGTRRITEVSDLEALGKGKIQSSPLPRAAICVAAK
jgi:hypothetical protein